MVRAIKKRGEEVADSQASLYLTSSCQLFSSLTLENGTKSNRPAFGTHYLSALIGQSRSHLWMLYDGMLWCVSWALTLSLSPFSQSWWKYSAVFFPVEASSGHLLNIFGRAWCQITPQSDSGLPEWDSSVSFARTNVVRIITERWLAALYSAVWVIFVTLFFFFCVSVLVAGLGA